MLLQVIELFLPETTAVSLPISSNNLCHVNQKHEYFFILNVV